MVVHVPATHASQRFKQSFLFKSEKIKDNIKSVVENVYKEVHRDTLIIEDKEEKLRRLEIMGRELLDNNIDRACKDAVFN